MTPRALIPPAGAAAAMAARVAALVPVIETERLRLRAPRVADIPAWQAIFAAPDAVHMGGPWDAEAAWEEFAYYTGGWMLYGHGLWSVELKDGTLVGFVMLGLEWDDFEPELGWMTIRAHRGNGYATEAARAARDHAAGLLGAGAFVSYVGAANGPSNAVAARLGARRDRAEEARIGTDTEHVWRHGGTA
ncbi:MAG: GNAT family N-acetyltransferase [Hasllibacter sp.]